MRARNLYRLEALPDKAIFYEGLHGAVNGRKYLQYPDLKIGVVPVINLEWIQNPSHCPRAAIRRKVMDIMLRECPIMSITFVRSSPKRTLISSGCQPSTPRTLPRADPNRRRPMVIIRFAKPRGTIFLLAFDDP
jgi:phosphoribulokinase